MRKLALFLLLPFMLFSQSVDERVTDISYLNGFGVFEEDAWKHIDYILYPTIKSEIFNNKTKEFEKEVDFKLLYNTNHEDWLVVLDYFEMKNQKHDASRTIAQLMLI